MKDDLDVSVACGKKDAITKDQDNRDDQDVLTRLDNLNNPDILAWTAPDQRYPGKPSNGRPVTGNLSFLMILSCIFYSYVLDSRNLI